MNRIRLTLAVLVTGAVGLTSVLPGRSSGSSCMFVEPWGLRFDAHAYAVVVPMGDTIEVGSQGAFDISFGFWASLKERIFGSPVHGQLARLVRYDGPWEGRLEGDDQDILIVPWGTSGTGSCAPIPWPESYRWLSPDSVFLVIGVPREPRHWKDKRPVIDMQAPYIYPGPYFNLESLNDVLVSLAGDAQSHVDSMLEAADRSLPSPVTLFEMYQAMPTFREARCQPDSADAALRNWEAANPELLKNYLLLKMFRFAKAWIQEYRECCAEDPDCEKNDEQSN
jgi:hypothetical protein